MNKENNTEIAELKAKLEIYEKWHNEDSKFPNLNSSFSSAQAADDEIDLRELWNVIWQGKWKIIAITFVFAVASVLYALSLPNIYKSEALLMPNSQESKGGGIGALAGQLGGLASLAGISLGGGSSDKTGYALEVLKSRKFLYKFIEDNNLKVPLMAAKGWNRETNTLIIDNDVYDESSKKWLSNDSTPQQPEPSLFKTYEILLKQNLSVSQDKESGMVTLAISHFSPSFSQQLVILLTKAINDTIKNQDLEEATKSINYLTKELNETNVTGMQTMFYQLIEQQQQTLMLTKVRDDYVLKVVDPAVVAENKAKPKRALIVVLGTMLGGILAVLLVFIRYFSNKD